MLGKDETWVTGGRHPHTWVTQKAGKEWDGHYICRKGAIQEVEYPSFTLTKTFVRGVYHIYLPTLAPNLKSNRASVAYNEEVSPGELS